MRAHRNGYGRCLSEGCSCMFGPAPQLRPTRAPAPGKVSEHSVEAERKVPCDVFKECVAGS